MHARDLARPCATVHADAPAARAAELLADGEADAVVVVSHGGHPLACLDAREILAGSLPGLVREDELRAAVAGDRFDQDVRENLTSLTVADVLPRPRRAPAVVSPHASPLQLAAVMTRTGSPVAVVVSYDADDRPHLLGTVTADAVLAHFR
ncbi:CBS domain-containing protein [Streptomyces sp. NPDC085466]|uniref:CBS domain-containing protein n=1 Tax=Streptomyces sp. NPDC085466 TaxID=3365725 RepID=UPI0037D74433